MTLRVLGMRVVALGGAGSAYIVDGPSGAVMLDCGTGAFERLWRSGALTALDAIVISHMHHDHMIDVLPFTSGIAQRSIAGIRPAARGRIELWVPRERGRDVLGQLSAVVANHQAADASGGAEPSRLERVFDIREYDASTEVQAAGLSLTFAKTVHSELCFAARVTDGSRTLVYTGDAAYSEPLVDLCRGADVVLADATFLHEDDATAMRGGHMNVAQAARLAAAAGAGALILTHFIPDDDDAVRSRVARAHFAGSVSLAAEGATYVVGT